MNVIGVVAQKGGVGKTHLTINWAVYGAGCGS